MRRPLAIALVAVLAVAAGTAAVIALTPEPRPKAKAKGPSSARPLSAPASAPPERRARADGRRDVILVTIDTLRADVLGAYGDPRGLSPTLDTFAAEGVVFERAYASSSWTVPTVATMMTGLHPHQHGVERGTFSDGTVMGQEALADELVLLPERMKALGYRTYGLTTNAHLTAELGYGQGFDRYANVRFEDAERVRAGVEALSAELAEGDAPFFLWVHYFEPHDNYRANAPFFAPILAADDTPELRALPERQRRKRVATWSRRTGEGVAKHRQTLRNPIDRAIVRALYGSEVRYVDEAIARTIQGLGDGPAPIVVVSADHGEAFMEHGYTGHRKALHEYLVRVPLIVWAPGLVPAGLRVAEPIPMVDLVPTLVGLAGGDAQATAAETAGRDLAPFWKGEPRAAAPILLSLERQDRRETGLVDGDWKLVRSEPAGKVSLYDLAADPHEKSNRAAEEPARVEQMTRALAALLADGRRAAAQTVAIDDPKVLEQLRAMGYVDEAAGGPEAEAEADPEAEAGQ